MRYKIVGINKDNGNHENPHEAVRAYIYEDTDGKLYFYYRQKMVDKIKAGDSAYAHHSTYGDAECYVRSNGHTEFLQTISDGKYTNNLLSLPEYEVD